MSSKHTTISFHPKPPDSFPSESTAARSSLHPWEAGQGLHGRAGPTGAQGRLAMKQGALPQVALPRTTSPWKNGAWGPLPRVFFF